ncbi:hypothetical protein HRbin16_00664 [bacterium HR16]|nr:hypothetical protein HRbin16_00664 [bacterium HR16]
MCAVGVFQQGERLVLYLDIVQASACGGGDLCRQSGEPAEHIQRVRCLVHQHPTAFAHPRGAPLRRVVICLIAVPRGYQLRAHYLPHDALLHRFTGDAVGSLGAHLEHHREHPARALCRVYHAIRLYRVNRHRLLGQHMQTLTKSVFCHFGMHRMRRSNDYRVHQPAINALFVIGEEGHVVLFAYALRHGGVNIGNRCQLHLLHFLHHFCMGGAHPPHADNP